MKDTKRLWVVKRTNWRVPIELDVPEIVPTRRPAVINLAGITAGLEHERLGRGKRKGRAR